MSARIEISDRKTNDRTFYVDSQQSTSGRMVEVRENGKLIGWVEKRDLTGRTPQYRAVKYSGPEHANLLAGWERRRYDALVVLAQMTRP